jgi:hypothetical protein
MKELLEQRKEAMEQLIELIPKMLIGSLSETYLSLSHDRSEAWPPSLCELPGRTWPHYWILCTREFTPNRA